MTPRRHPFPIARAAAAVALLVWLGQRTWHRSTPPRQRVILAGGEGPGVWAADIRTDGEGWLGVGRRMPEEPFKGQRTPPCAPAQVSINGGCWYQVTPAPGSVRHGEACSSEMYERGGKCFIPVLRAERQPTTIQKEKP